MRDYRTQNKNVFLPNGCCKLESDVTPQEWEQIHEWRASFGKPLDDVRSQRVDDLTLSKETSSFKWCNTCRFSCLWESGICTCYVPIDAHGPELVHWKDENSKRYWKRTESDIKSSCPCHEVNESFKHNCDTCWYNRGARRGRYGCCYDPDRYRMDGICAWRGENLYLLDPTFRTMSPSADNCPGWKGRE